MGSNSSLSNISIFWLNFYWNSCPHNTYVLFDRTPWKYGSLLDGRNLHSLNPATPLPEITRPSGRKSDFHGFWMIGRLFWVKHGSFRSCHGLYQIVSIKAVTLLFCKELLCSFVGSQLECNPVPVIL